LQLPLAVNIKNIRKCKITLLGKKALFLLQIGGTRFLDTMNDGLQKAKG
jgi:hypothetical protein